MWRSSLPTVTVEVKSMKIWFESRRLGNVTTSKLIRVNSSLFRKSNHRGKSSFSFVECHTSERKWIWWNSVDIDVGDVPCSVVRWNSTTIECQISKRTANNRTNYAGNTFFRSYSNCLITMMLHLGNRGCHIFTETSFIDLVVERWTLINQSFFLRFLE